MSFMVIKVMIYEGKMSKNGGKVSVLHGGHGGEEEKSLSREISREWTSGDVSPLVI